jgi:hypothetical protein
MRPACEQWEYRIVFVNHEHLEVVLNNHGGSGWEAWSITHSSETSERVIFKRRRA